MLKKADTFQGKRKVKDWWSKVEYEVIHQVANGVPAYEIKDTSGNLKVAHCNRLFLLATPRGQIMPLCESADSSMSIQSALAENNMPKDPLERCLTHHLTSHVLLGWVDGVLQQLPMVVYRSAQKEPGSRMNDMCEDDEEAH